MPNGLTSKMTNIEIKNMLNSQTRWRPKSYRYTGDNCTHFAYWLVNKITEHDAVEPNKWPPCFVEMDAILKETRPGRKSCFGGKNGEYLNF